MTENKTGFIILIIISTFIGCIVGSIATTYFFRDPEIIRIGVGISIIEYKYEGFSGLQLSFTATNGTKILVPITGSMRLMSSHLPGRGFEIKEIYSDSIGIKWIEEEKQP